MLALRPSVILPIDFMNIKKLVYSHAYDLVAAIMAWETMKALTLAAVLGFPAIQ